MTLEEEQQIATHSIGADHIGEVRTLKGTEAVELSTTSPILEELLAGTTVGAEPYSSLITKCETKVTEEGGPDFPEVSKQGRILPSQVNLLYFLDWLGIALAYDDFTLDTIVKGVPRGPYLDDAAIGDIYTALDRFGVTFKLGHLVTLLEAYARTIQVHVPRELFRRLEEKWDGVARLDTWLSDYCQVEDSAYARAVAAKTLIASVRRVRVPGTKFDTVTILEGKGGIRKSTAWRVLAYGRWHDDNLSIGASAKETIELSRGVLFHEFAELADITKRDVETIKKMLSRHEDSARLAYGRKTTRVLRQWIAVGTTNKSTYLRDETGNRRFWPVLCRGQIDTESLMLVRDQLWAEAATRESEGEAIHLSADIEVLATLEQDKRLDLTDAQHGILDMLEGLSGFVPNDELYEALDVPLCERNAGVSNSVRAALTLHGWVSRSVRVGAEPAFTRRGYLKGELGDVVLRYDITKRRLAPTPRSQYQPRGSNHHLPSGAKPDF